MSTAALPRQDALARLHHRYPVSVAEESDREDILRLYESVWSSPVSRQRFRARFDNTYEGNPAGAGIQSIILCRRGATLVGFMGLLRCEIWCRNRLTPAAFGVDLCVLPAYHGMGIGTLLQSHLSRQPIIPMDGNSNEAAARVAVSLGARAVDSCDLWRRWSRPGDLWRAEPSGELTIRSDAPIDERFDALWEQAMDAQTMISVRNRSILSWRYERNPLRRFCMHTIESRGRLLGYVVTTFRPAGRWAQSAVLVDYLVAPEGMAHLEVFLGQVLARLARRGAVYVDLLVSHARYRAGFAAAGFTAKERGRPFWVYENDVTRGDPRYWDGCAWHLTFGDADYFLT
jgi:GNAT superfamily N-acetyltransferase